MRRLTGQAGRVAAVAARAVLLVLVMATVLTACGLAVLSWRLSRGPLEAPWLARQLEAAANDYAAPTRIAIGAAAIAWEGWRRGLDSSLDIRLSAVRATDAAGAPVADVPHAFVALSPRALLRARLRPRSIDVEGARLRLSRAADGSVSLGESGPAAPAPEPAGGPKQAGSDPVPGLVKELGRPAATDRTEPQASFAAQLRHVHIGGATLAVADDQLGTTWRVPRLDLDLTRSPPGGVDGQGAAEIELGGERVALRLTAAAPAGGARTEVKATVGPLQPAALARASPRLAPLAALDAPVSVTAEAELGPRLALRAAHMEARAEPGRVRLGASVAQLAGAAATVDAEPDHLTLRKLTASLRARDGGLFTQLQAQGEARRTAQAVQGTLILDLDQAAFADLPALWPEGAGGHAREWVTENIPSGTARNGHVEVEIAGAPDLSAVTLTRSTGTVSGDDLTVHWLRPVPPIEHARAKLRILDPDTLEIAAEGGQQDTDPAHGPITIRGGRIRITGLEQHHQTAVIDADNTGALADVIALLSQPRLRLLDKHPLPGRDPGGEASVRMHVQLPLQNDVTMDDVAIHAQAHLTGARLRDIVAGRDLDQGTLDLDATNDGLKVNGDARLAGIAAQLAVAMDFRPGPPSQVLQKVTASGRASTAAMAAAGVDPGPLVSGTADLSAVLTEQRNGKGLVQADADLLNAELSAAPIGWRKPPGSPARLSARVVLEHDKLTGIEALSLEGKDVSVRGAADYAGGRVAALRFERMILGRTEAQGVVRFPRTDAAGPVQATFKGPVIDLSAISTHEKKPPPAPKPDAAGTRPSRAWSLNARFDRALMAGGRSWLGLAGSAENDGTLFRRLSLTGETSPGQPLRFELGPKGGNRALSASAADAGALLAGLDLTRAMQGGRLTVSGAFDDGRADHPLSGTADITAFRVRDPHGLGRLLQAMTLYGLVQAASGPGLGFTRLTAPFTLTADALELGQARAFSPSLGLTAKGRVDLRSNVANIEGTIVPAYFFNSLLGQVPLIGKLFSPEQGGGLFAASYTIRGPLDDPKVSVNPLSALTPGFLRGVFDLF